MSIKLDNHISLSNELVHAQVVEVDFCLANDLIHSSTAPILVLQTGLVTHSYAGGVAQVSGNRV